MRSSLQLPIEKVAKDTNPKPPKYLVDAYCGSGLFSITCSAGIDKVVGVEIAADSVKHAIANAKANNIQNAEFIVGDANTIFKVCFLIVKGIFKI